VSDEAIEKDAQSLLAEYADARSVRIEPPTAIDDIIEKYLQIGIEFDDTLQPSEPMDHAFVEIARHECRVLGAVFTENDDQAPDSFATLLAERFLVSPIAMRIRLERLGLLHRTVPLQRLLSDRS
jgi:hypothetical protein